jgi:hypothetical protein
LEFSFRFDDSQQRFQIGFGRKDMNLMTVHRMIAIRWAWG